RRPLEVAVRPAPHRPCPSPDAPEGRPYENVQLQRRNPILMNKILLSSAAFALALPTAVSAQAAGSILIVDSDRVMSECTACKSAGAQLQSRHATLRARAQTPQTQLQNQRKRA